jgi:superfamily II DNA or RNA helicase
MADGHCEECGRLLNQSFHADHIVSYSRGGITELPNGQALCPQCNLRKGNKTMSKDKVVYRPFQRQMIDAALNLIGRNDNVLMVDSHPGMGKTLGSTATLNDLYRAGIIKTAAVFTPRLNLCQQYELDWKEVRPKFAQPVMGPILHRDNVEPLIRENQFGYVTTYSSLISQSNIHFKLFRKFAGGIGMVLDEAQLLGADEFNGMGTESAWLVQKLAEFARFIIVMTGTPYRADKLPLLFGKYTEPDFSGIRYLESHVRATYMQGVALGSLRKFEYELFDGRALYEYIDGESEELIVSDMEAGLAKVLTHPDYWRVAVDRTVEAVREVQKSDARYCGLIGAANQEHAKEIQDYVVAHHNVKALLAVSDEKKAQDNLRRFKSGGYDLLITVGMAHVGYDHKPITIVTCLNGVRQIGWLDQFFARGMRVMPDIPFDNQTVRCIVPDDRRMKTYVRNKRMESQEGLRERQPGGPPPPPPQPRLGTTTFAEATDTSAMGMDHAMDLDSEAYEFVSQIKKEYSLGGANLTGLGALLRDKGIMQEKAKNKRESEPRDMKTEKEKEAEWNRKIQAECAIYDKRLGAPDVVNWGYSNGSMLSHFRESRTRVGRQGLEERYKWLTEVFYHQIKDRFIR